MDYTRVDHILETILMLKSRNCRGLFDLPSFFLDNFHTWRHIEQFKPGPPKQCYNNANLAVLTNPHFLYVEGYIVNEAIGLPVEHAWVYDSRLEIPLEVTSLAENHNSKYIGIIYPRDFLLDLIRPTPSGIQSSYRGNVMDSVCFNALYLDEHEMMYLN